MVGLRVVAIASLGACGFSGKATSDAMPEPGDDATAPGDMVAIDLAPAVDMPPPRDDCFGTLPETHTCLAMPLPSTSLTFAAAPSQLIDTDTYPCAATIDGTQDGVCVVAATSIVIGSTVYVTGGKPLLLLATTGSIMVDATLDVRSSSAPGSGPGPGFDDGPCDMVNPGLVGGGGAGGSFASAGGSGGGSGGATAGAVVALAGKLRGGCPGSAGGSNTGSGGEGGGGVALVAKTTIMVSDIINASGAYGEGGFFDGSGGGGGGSGGLIVLDAEASIMVGGRLRAEGGGGGEGASTFSGSNGGEVTNTLATQALGGSGGNMFGGDGGDGSFGATPARAGAAGTGGGGGGGGGGAGVIRVSRAVSGCDCLPTPQ